MKILRVIVDELPKSASRCDEHRANWNQLYTKLDVGCNILKDYWLMSERDFTTTRCPNCPLALEHDNKKIANEVM